MAFGKKIVNEISGKKHHKFLDGLKDWVTSPGGIITIIGVVIVIWWAHHTFKTKSA